jgi:hypothetical protein
MNHINQAVETARLIDDGKERAKTLLFISNHLVNIDCIHIATKVANSILANNTNINELYANECNLIAYRYIFSKLLIKRDMTRFIKIFAESPDHVKSKCGFAICKKLVSINMTKQAFEVASLIPDIGNYYEVNKWILMHTIEQEIAHFNPFN